MKINVKRLILNVSKNGSHVNDSRYKNLFRFSKAKKFQNEERERKREMCHPVDDHNHSVWDDL